MSIDMVNRDVASQNKLKNIMSKMRTNMTYMKEVNQIPIKSKNWKGIVTHPTTEFHSETDMDTKELYFYDPVTDDRKITSRIN